MSSNKYNFNHQSDKFKERELINNYELGGIIIIFLIVLAVLFPKARLKEYILAEKSNYTLAKSYLEALVKAYPKHSDFIRYLIEFDLKLYDIKDAYNIISEYKNRFHDTHFKMLSYKIIKELYFNTKKNKYKKEAKDILKSLLNKKPLFVLKEAKAFNFLDLEFLAYKKLNIIDNDFLNLALYFKDYELAEKIINQLYDKSYNINYLIKKAQIEEVLKKYNKASKLYLFIYKKTGNIKYFKKAFYILVWNQKYKEATKLAKRYEKLFLAKNNFDILKEFLEYYLAIRDLKSARNLSLKIKKKLKI